MTINMGDCPREYLEFHDTEEEMRQEYEKDGCTKVVMPDGRLLSPWDEAFRRKGSFAVIGSSTHEVPPELKQREVPYKELFATFKDFAKEWHGCEESDPETGRYGYWENPNRKWDWYQIGGRWTGHFKLKDGCSGKAGSPGIMTETAKPGYADQARKRDIDFDGMRDAAGTEAAAKWDKVRAGLGDTLGAFIPWPVMRDEVHKGNIDAARNAYHEQEAVKAFRTVFDHPFASVEEFLDDRETYIKAARDSAASTFAVLKDGQWYERGSMGWWGCVSDEKDQGIWLEEFNKLLDGLPDETLLTVVDCHI